jgi:hypothetical protein
MAARLALILALLLGNTLNGTPAGAADEEIRFTLAVCDKVGLDPSVLKHARTTVVRIFSNAGIHVDWVDSESSSPETAFSTNSYEHCSLKSNAYVLAVITDAKPKQNSIDAMGLAPKSGNLFTQRVYVLHQRLSQFVTDYHKNARNSELGEILGAVLGHELGHLFLPGKPHARIGLMRAEWGYPQAAEAASGNLLFGEHQAAAMQAFLRERNARLLRAGE